MIKGSIVLILLILRGTLAISQNWEIPGSVDGPVTRIYADTTEGLLYLGGRFKNFDSTIVNGIMAWDGIQAFTLGGGRTNDCWSSGCLDLVFITKFENKLFIGRVNNIIDGTTAKGIASWNQSQWDSLAEGLTDIDNNSGIPFDSYIYGNAMIVGGAFQKAGNMLANSLAKWDGLQWESIEFPQNVSGSLPFITSVQFFNNKLYVAGNFRIMLNGTLNDDITMLSDTGWVSVSNGILGGESYIQDMTVYDNELYVCGYFRSLDGNMGNKIMRWNGEQWKDVAGGLCSPFDIAERMLVYDDKLIVVGIFDCVGGGLTSKNIAAWDGQKWCSFGNDSFNNKIRDIAYWQGDIYIGGAFTEINGQPVKFFARYVGDHSTDTCSAPIVAAPEPATETPQLLLTPNPATESVQITLQGPSSEAPVQWTVVNALGREVWRGNGNPASVTVKHWPAGMYFCTARWLSGKVATGRFLKD